jgi:hypothetical protein
MKIVIIILIVAVFGLIIYQCNAKKSNKDMGQVNNNNQLSLRVDTPISFGYKCMWIAVKTNNKEKVAEILGLKETHPENWKKGIEEAYNDKVFITPQIGEWTLVVGYGLAGKNSKNELDEANSYKDKINKLSKEFGEAQFFATHRVTEYHLWAKSLSGQTVRIYSYVGEKGENILIEGQPTTVENKYKLVNTFSKEAKDEKYFDRNDLVVPDEELVMKIAANWSVDPSTLEGRKDIKPGLGIIGQ